MRGTLYTAAGVAVCALLAVIVFFAFAGIQHVEGHQLAIKETFMGGVDAKVYPPKKYIYFRPTTDFITYDMRIQNFIMNDKDAAEGETGLGRARDAYTFPVGKGNQPITVSMTLRWQYDSANLHAVHKNVRNDPIALQERVLRNPLMRIVKDKATTKEALTIYSGQGLVDLQQEIETALLNEQEFKDKGVQIVGFVIEDIGLDPAYAEEISKKQLAVQKALRMEKEKLANLKEADSAEAKAQIAKKQAVVHAEQLKEVGILAKEQEKAERVLQAEASAQEKILAAEAAKKDQLLRAEGERDAFIARAKGIEAKGLAEAKVDGAKRDAQYSGTAGQRRAAVQIASYRVEMLKGIRGIMPEKVAMTIIGESLQGNMKSFALDGGN
jgi:regulator of protease activity HflC (stomatin/prohibitin superfamily)